jgi:hypothetical protein
LRYDLPYLLTCLVAALLCNCNSTEAVGQWCQDHHHLLRVAFGPRDFSTPSGSLYRRLLPRLDAQAIEVVLATWVRSSRPQQDEEAVAFDGKTLRGAGTAEQPAPHWASLSDPSEPGNEARKCAKAEKTNEIPEALAVLPCLPNTPRVYTADALHTHAAFMQVAHDLHDFSLLTVKANQPLLFADLHLAFTDPATTLLPEEPPLIERRRGRNSGTQHPGHDRASMTTCVRAGHWCNKSPNSHAPSLSSAPAIAPKRSSTSSRIYLPLWPLPVGSSS